MAGIFRGLFDRVTGRHQIRTLSGRLNRAVSALETTRRAVIAAQSAGGAGSWAGSEDVYQNTEVMAALEEVMRRAQDLDINNPDLRGFHRRRSAGAIGRGIRWMANAKAEEIGLQNDETIRTNSRLNRLRDLHGNSGGFDSKGLGRSEFKLQEQAFLTHLILGSCLVHRVWNSNPNRLLPLELEIIPGSRVSTPFERLGSPTTSYGVEYSDEHRSRVVGFHVRRVPKTVGNSMIPDYQWDFVPIADAAWMTLCEPSGLDRSLPLSVAVVRTLRNRGEFVESVIRGARAAAQYFGVIECAPGVDPYGMAQDAMGSQSSNQPSDQNPSGYVELDGVRLYFAQNGEKVNWTSAKLPDPDFSGFMGVTDERLARGLSASPSRFSGKVTGSYSAGRQEEQQDEPVVDQLLENFESAWSKVHGWFIESCWLADMVEMPGYSTQSAVFWNQARIQRPGKVHINPVDTAAARGKGYEQKSITPQQICEEDGRDLSENLEQWAQAEAQARAKEVEYKLPEGTLSFQVAQTKETMKVNGADEDDLDAPPQKRSFLNFQRNGKVHANGKHA